MVFKFIAFTHEKNYQEILSEFQEKLKEVQLLIDMIQFVHIKLFFYKKKR